MKTCSMCRHAGWLGNKAERLCRRTGGAVGAQDEACEEFRISARTYLESIERGTKLMNSLADSALSYREMAMKATGSMEALRSGGTSSRSKVESGMVGCIDIAKQLEDVADGVSGKVATACRLIARMENTGEAEILVLRHIARLDWSEINDKIGYAERHTRRLYNRALESFERELDKEFEKDGR